MKRSGLEEIDGDTKKLGKTSFRVFFGAGASRAGFFGQHGEIPFF
jgi:hypothetical protein